MERMCAKIANAHLKLRMFIKCTHCNIFDMMVPINKLIELNEICIHIMNNSGRIFQTILTAIFETPYRSYLLWLNVAPFFRKPRIWSSTAMIGYIDIN